MTSNHLENDYWNHVDEESGRILKSFCIAATPTTTVDENPMITDAVN